METTSVKSHNDLHSTYIGQDVHELRVKQYRLDERLKDIERLPIIRIIKDGAPTEEEDWKDDS